MPDGQLVEVDDPIYHSFVTEKYIDYQVSYNDGTKVYYKRLST